MVRTILVKVDGITFLRLVIRLLELIILGSVTDLSIVGTNIRLTGNSGDALGILRTRLLASAIGQAKMLPIIYKRYICLNSLEYILRSSVSTYLQ